MFDTSLKDDLLAMNYSILQMELHRGQIYNNLCVVTNAYNQTVTYSANNINARLPEQLARLSNDMLICNSDLNIIQHNIIAQLHANCETLNAKIAEILAKGFLPDAVKLKAILYIGVYLLEHRRKLYIETGTLSATSTEIIQAYLELSILLKVEHESLTDKRENIEKLVTVMFLLREFALLEASVSVGLTCHGSKVISLLCSGINGLPEWTSAYNLLQAVIIKPSEVTSSIVTNVVMPNKTQEAQVIINKSVDILEKKVQHPELPLQHSEVKHAEVDTNIITKLVATPIVTQEFQGKAETDEWKQVVRNKSKKKSAITAPAKQPGIVKHAYVEEQPTVPIKTQLVKVPGNTKEIAPEYKPVSEAKIVSGIVESAETVILAVTKVAVKKVTVPPVKSPATILRNEMLATIQTFNPETINVLLNRELARHQFIHENIIAEIYKAGDKIQADFFAKISLPIYMRLRVVSETTAFAEHKLLLLHTIFSITPEEFYKLDKSLNILSIITKLLSEARLQSEELKEQKNEFVSKVNIMENAANAWFASHKSEMYNLLANTKPGKNFDIHRLNLIMNTTNDLQQTPVMIAIKHRLNHKTISSLIDLNKSTLMQRDDKGRNCLDYWAIYGAENLEYVEHMSNIMLECSDDKNIKKELLTKLYQKSGIDGNSWLHLLILHNSKQVVMDAVVKLAKFSGRDILFAAAYAKNLQRQSAWYLLEAMQVYWNDVALALVQPIVNSVVTINNLFNKNTQYAFPEDTTFFSARKPQSPTDFVANPIFLPINMNDLRRMSQVLINRYTLRSNIIQALQILSRSKKTINHAIKFKFTDKSQLTEVQLSIIAYFQCAPDQIELFQIISEEHTLHGHLMQKFCDAKDLELEKITRTPAFMYAEDMLPLSESLAWRKIITHLNGDADVRITEENVKKIKDHIINLACQSSAVYIAGNLSNVKREYLPLEMAIMDDSLALIKFLCEVCGDVVTSEILLFGFFDSETYGDMQEYLLSKYSNGLSKDKLNLIAFRIYVQELNATTFNSDKARWLIEHDLHPTNTDEKGNNLLHMIITLLTHDQLRELVLINFVNFLRSITVNSSAVIRFLMEASDRSGNDYLDILNNLHRTKKISDSDRETIMRGVCSVRMEAEARDAPTLNASGPGLTM